MTWALIIVVFFGSSRELTDSIDVLVKPDLFAEVLLPSLYLQ